jgi:hypothetical protein
LREQRETKVVPFAFVFDPPGCPVDFSVYKNGQPIIEKKDIGDDSDYFADGFPDHSWVSDSILWLGHKDYAELGHDEVEVTNDSQQAISYLQVKTCGWEMFWLLDVKSGETVKLDSCPRIRWLDSYGRFADGKEIPSDGENFKIEGKYKMPGHYYIKITDDKMNIYSPDFEGYK